MLFACRYLGRLNLITLRHLPVASQNVQQCGLPRSRGTQNGCQVSRPEEAAKASQNDFLCCKQSISLCEGSPRGKTTNPWL
jgi:hypothetical protein